MIYKLESDNFDQIDFDLLREKFCFLSIEGVLYLAITKAKDAPEATKILKEILQDSEYDLIEITEKNILYEAPIIRDWCRDNFVRLEKEKYENNEQEKLLKVWKDMDFLEQELQKQLNKK